MSPEQLYSLYISCGTYTTDSRDCPAGSLFIALRGEAFDGNRFAAAALDKGCAKAIVSDPAVATDDRFVLVPDTLEAFRQIALQHRLHSAATVIGITGTNGKTTTKELVAAVLSRKYRTLATEANYNNEIGVPKTLLRLRPEHQMAIVEMGASHPGDIRRLVEIARPTFGLITNVGRAHLQGFGSFEGVVRTKGELYDFLRSQPGSTAFVNTAQKELMATVKGIDNITMYGPAAAGSPAAVQGTLGPCAPFLTFTWEYEGRKHNVATRLVGSYNMDNMLAAIAIGLRFGVPEDEISAALADYTPSNNRSQLTITDRNRLIVDAYNANPTSMRAALNAFRDIEATDKMAILGDMRELGEASQAEHKAIVAMLGECNIDNVWLVGQEFAATNPPFPTFPDAAAVEAELEAHPVAGRTILIKGSNSIRLAPLAAKL